MSSAVAKSPLPFVRQESTILAVMPVVHHLENCALAFSSNKASAFNKSTEAKR